MHYFSKWYNPPPHPLEIRAFRIRGKAENRKVAGLVRISDKSGKFAAPSQVSRCLKFNAHSSRPANFPGVLALKFEFLMLKEKAEEPKSLKREQSVPRPFHLARFQGERG